MIEFFNKVKESKECKVENINSLGDEAINIDGVKYFLPSSTLFETIFLEVVRALSERVSIHSIFFVYEAPTFAGTSYRFFYIYKNTVYTLSLCGADKEFQELNLITPKEIAFGLKPSLYQSEIILFYKKFYNETHIGALCKQSALDYFCIDSDFEMIDEVNTLINRNNILSIKCYLKELVLIGYIALVLLSLLVVNFYIFR